MGDAAYTPQDPDAYAVRPRYVVGRWSQAPIVVDAPGVFVGGDGDEGRAQLVPWESIVEIVLYDTSVPYATERRLVDSVGLRLRRRPDVVAIRRVLDTWQLDRPDLEAAVARFAPDVAVVDGPPQLPLSPEALDGPAPEPGAPQPPAATPAPAPAEPGAPAPVYGTPTDPGAAYVVKPDRNTIGRPLMLAALGALVIVVAVGVALESFRDDSRTTGGSTSATGPDTLPAPGLAAIAVIVGLLLFIPLLKHRLDARRGVVYIAADAGGLHLGAGRTVDDTAAPPLSLPWSSISTVVVFELERQGRSSDGDPTTNSYLVIGVTGPDAPDRLAHHVLAEDFDLDRARLETAVDAYGGGVAVVTWPAVVVPRDQTGSPSPDVTEG